MFGIEIHNHKWLSKEQKTLCHIIDAFKGEEMIDQYQVDGYRIDLYFKKYMLAIECDEFDHKDRDIGYEVKRQKYIEDKLIPAIEARFCIVDVFSSIDSETSENVKSLLNLSLSIREYKIPINVKREIILNIKNFFSIKLFRKLKKFFKSELRFLLGIIKDLS